jgi:hypothetical protein
MARPRTGIASKSVVKPAAEPADFSTWTAQAERILEKEHDVKPQAVRPSVWRDAFIRNLSPEEGAERAATAAHNARPTFDGVGGRLKRSQNEQTVTVITAPREPLHQSLRVDGGMVRPTMERRLNCATQRMPPIFAS